LSSLQKEITGTQTSFSTNFGGKLSFILCFLFAERLRCSYIYIYIFTAATCTTTIITFKPCALNDEFHHFKPRFNKIVLPCWILLKERIGGAKGEEIGGKTEGDFMDNSIH
jgi:hypothetical protein